jgi:hypothetical protein
LEAPDGKYLVRAKYVYIGWSNKSVADRTLIGLARELRAIAEETDVKLFPDYAPPSTGELAQSTREIEAAKSYLIDGDKISYVVPGEPPAEFDLAIKWDEEELKRILVKETITAAKTPMTLIVKRPDCLGRSRWDFRHGGKQISARISDTVWLAKFQSRQIDVRPGDALRCLVDIENFYGYDNELISESFDVVKVNEVLENRLEQRDLDFGDLP